MIKNIPDHKLYNPNGPLPSMDVLRQIAQMQPVDNVSGLNAWQLSRLGKITGSQFCRVTFGQGGKGWSQGAQTYLHEIVGEWMTGRPATEFSSKATDWGNEWEPEAIKRYENATGRKVKTGVFFPAKGFNLVGATPDGEGERGLEVKCPITPTNHIRTIESGLVPLDYRDQVTGHLLVTSKDICDFFSFHPMMKREEWKTKLVEVERNELAIEELTERLFAFEEALIKRLDRLDIDWRNPDYFKVAV